jgi:molecular chaperone GrpE
VTTPRDKNEPDEVVEPSAALGEEPSAALGEEPSAAPGEEPSAAPGEEPSAALGKEPSAAPAEEPPGGTLAANDELEAALREATESVEAREAERQAEPRSGEPASADKILLEALSEELQAGREQFEELTKERDELKDRFLRLQAEFENFRRRTLKERQEAHNYGHQNVVKDLLPTVDNLDRAMAHSVESAEGSGGQELRALLQGIELVQRELLGVLGKHGVTKIEAADHTFDPAIHEAMTQVVDDSVPPGTIVQVLEEGYQLKDRMLRPARVVVSKHSESAAGSELAPAEPESSSEDSR